MINRCGNWNNFLCFSVVTKLYSNEKYLIISNAVLIVKLNKMVK